MAEKRYTYAGWIEAFQIFAEYGEPDDMIEIAAEHDVIYAGPNPEAVTPPDMERLTALGWHAIEEYSCFEHYT